MRRNATKVAAAVLSLAVTMTSVNIPTSAAAATKKVKLNKTKATLTVGKSTTLKLKQGTKVLKATFTSNKPKIAKVGKKTGKVTAKKKGTATITATYKKKKYKCKITVKAKAKPTVKPTAAPTTEPTAAPTTEPTAAPTDAPSTEPTAAPADTVGAITSVEAKSATTIVATFESALPATAVLTLTKGTTDTGVKAVIDEARTTATFTSASKYAVGTYTVTATAGESKQSKDVEIKEQSVQDIVIKSKQALTDHSKKKIYVYYDVVDQYGESMRTSTSVSWSSGSGTVKVDKSTGRLLIAKTEEFRYGENVYLVGVDTKSGKSVQATLPVGMERALDTIKFEGFINVDDKGTILETLPKDFAGGKYYLLFTAYDQDGNEMESERSFTDTGSPKVTFIADKPTLIKSEFVGKEIITIKGKKYCSVSVEPGMFVDKGGEVNITAISNTTGNKTTKNFVIGAGAVLSSLTLSAPTDTIADGDQDVNIPFVAKDTEGKDVTNYETIVRSTNQLKLTASAGVLTVYETNSGAAAIKWSDTVSAKDFTTSSSHDGVDRPISLVTTVIGGESNNVMMYVADTRRPVAVSSVKLNEDNNNTITESNQAEVTFFSTKKASGDNKEYDGEFSDVKYIDQYGKVLDEKNNARAKAFFEQAASKDGFNGKKYGVKVDYSSISDNSIIDKTEIVSSSSIKKETENFVVLQNDGVNNKLTIKTREIASGSKNAITENIRYSIVRLEDDKENEWDTVDTNLSIDYSVVPVRGLSNLRINDIAKIRLRTNYTDWENGDAIEAASGSSIALSEDNGVAKVEKGRDVVVAGSYDGKTVTVPNKFYKTIEKDKDGKATFVVTKDTNEDGTVNVYGNAKITGLIDYTDVEKAVSGSIKYNDLYDFNTARHTRKDARKDVSVIVYENDKLTGDALGTVKTSVSISDAISYPVKIVFHQNGGLTDKLVLNPKNTVYKLNEKIGRIANSWDSSEDPAVLVTDQYGDAVSADNYGIEYSVTNPVENAGEFAHLSKSFTVNQNNSLTTSITGTEILDKFDLTATVAGTSVSTKASATVGADECANINSAGNDEHTGEKDTNGKDLTLRDTLGYSR